MTKKKKLTIRTTNWRNKNTSKGKGKKSNTVANSITLKNQCTDLKSKFKLKELRIILHDIAVDNIILQHKKHIVSKNKGSLKVVDKCEKYTDSNGNKKDKEFGVANDIGCSSKPENTNPSIAVTNSNQNLSVDLLNEATSVPNIRTGNKGGKQNINFNEQNIETCVKKKNLMKDKYPIVQTDEESPKETQKILMNRKSITKVKNQNFPKEKNLPMKDNRLIARTNEELPKKAQKILMKLKDTNKVNNLKFPKGRDLLVKDKCPSVQTDEESPKETQNILMNLKNMNKVNSHKFPKGRNLPMKDNRLIVRTNEELPKKAQKILMKLKDTNKVNSHKFPKGRNLPMKGKCPSVQIDEESPKETQNILMNLKNRNKVNSHKFPKERNLQMKDKCPSVQTDEESPKETQKILMNLKNTNKVNNQNSPTRRDLPMKDKCPTVQTDEESLKATQKILMNLKNTNEVYNQNFLKGRDLPKITEETILAKNTILLQAPNNMQIANNLQDKAYYTDAELQNKSKESLSIEKHSRVVDLTEDNLHKFTENYDKCPVSQENVTSLNATENLLSSGNSSSNDINLKTNKDDLHFPYRKRGWIAQKTIADLDNTDMKRIKLNRKCIQETSCTTKSSSVCLSDNKNSNLISKCHSQDINNVKIQDKDDHLTLHSNNGNSLCIIQLKSELNKADFDDILRSTHVEKENISSSSHIIFNGENEKNELLLTEKYYQNAENIVENNSNENKILNCRTQLGPQNQVESKINDNHNDGHNDGSGNVDHSNDCGHDDNYNNGGGEDDNCNKGGGEDDNCNKGGGEDDNCNNGGGEDDNCNNGGGGDDNCNNDAGDDDYISLFTDSLLSVDPIVVTSNENRAKNTSSDYKMTGTIFNKYFQQNILECNKEFDTIQEHDTLEDKDYEKSYQAKCEKIGQNSIPTLEKQSINVESIRSVSPHVINNNNGSCPDNNYNKYTENVVGDDKTALTCTKQMEPITCHGICRGYCFSKMRHGDCNKTPCYFNHDLQTLIRNIILKYKQYLTSIIHYTYSMKYHYFLKRLYLQSIQECNVACIMDLYEKLYSMQYAHSDIVCITVQALLNKGMHLKNVVDSLCKMLISTDKWTPQYILNSVKDNIEVGEYWDILHNLLTYVKPTKEVIESILNDCLITRKHIQDVHVNLIKRLHLKEVNQLNKNLMLSFNSLLMHEYQKTPDKTSLQSTSVSNNNEGCFEKTYALQAISDLPETQSQYRDRFWKLYLMIYNIKEALVHKDYDYVISILTKYEEMNEDETLFSRCCFHMLTAEIKHSEYHISKIIEHAGKINRNSLVEYFQNYLREDI